MLGPNCVNKSKIPKRNGCEDTLSVNMIQLPKQLNWAERNRMLISSDAKPNNTCFILNKGELSILKDKKGRIHKGRETRQFSFSVH